MCIIEGCGRAEEGPTYHLCKSHAQKFRKTKDMADLYCNVCRNPLALGTRFKFHKECKVCKYDGCLDTFFQKGYCRKHYMRFHRSGGLTPTVPLCKVCKEPTGTDALLKAYCEPCRKKSVRLARIRANNRRRSRSGDGEYYDIQMLLAIDGTDCYLCSEQLDDKPSIDHVLALSLGGTDSVDNVALTHWACNNKKLARTIESCAIMFINMKLPERMRTNVSFDEQAGNDSVSY